jgi:hypothetical protein
LLFIGFGYRLLGRKNLCRGMKSMDAVAVDWLVLTGSELCEDSELAGHWVSRNAIGERGQTGRLG